MILKKFEEMGLLKKCNMTLASCIRNTSCSRGWLRLLMQTIFGSIIVSSFILIVIMALERTSKEVPEQPNQCFIKMCRVICNEIPFFGEHEDQIINAVSSADANCENIAVELNKPTFKDSTLPEFWLSRMRSSVHELAIIGGNIIYIQPNAFMSPFSNNLNTLILEEIMIVPWETEMLVGLSNLRKLFIKDCMLGDIKRGALRPVDDTLYFLNIKAKSHWSPRNVTGSSQDLELREVDFSSNDFYDILMSTSFTKLRKCKVLFLNSCKIKSIGEGTFDNLQSIEVIYLNNNYLVTIPVGLFEALLPHRPRIALQDNFWHCDCSNYDLREIQKSGLLIVDPLCRYPDAVRGMTFSDFEGFCSENENPQSDTNITGSLNSNDSISFIIYSNGVCRYQNSSFYNSLRQRIISPSKRHECILNRMIDFDVSVPVDGYSIISSKDNWITPVFFVEQSPYAMLEISAHEQPGVGLIWYQSSCYTEVFCVNRIPKFLKVYNAISDVRYTFCPFNITTGIIFNYKCVFYDLGNFEHKVSFYRDIVIYLCLSLGCLIFGAVCVYAVIFKNPSLLKANKRVLFVKHKSIEALIMPPTVPLRKNLINESDSFIRRFIEKQKIFVLPDLGITSTNFIRSTSSTRSVVSNDGSYISALQPTEEQLREWRSNQIVNQCDNGPCSGFDTSSFSSFYDHESFPYYTLHTSEKIYEVPKNINSY